MSRWLMCASMCVQHWCSVNNDRFEYRNKDKFTSELFLIDENDLIVHDNYDKMETRLKVGQFLRGRTEDYS